MKKIITKIFVLAFALTLVLVPFTQGYASASSGPDLQTPADSEPVLYNETHENNLVFSNGTIVDCSIVAANYIPFMRDTVNYEFKVRSGDAVFDYSITVAFYDIDGNVKDNARTISEAGVTNASGSMECRGSWAWAADYVICSFSVTCGGETKSFNDIRMYFWD